MYGNWQNNQGYQLYGQPHGQWQGQGSMNYQQQQWYYQQQQQAGGQWSNVQQPPLPTEPENTDGVNPAPPVEPPKDDKPPLPDEPPPEPPVDDTTQAKPKVLAPISAEEQEKLNALKAQAAQWQQQQLHSAPPVNPSQSPEVQSIIREEKEFEQQYKNWQQQYQDWKEQNKNHPNQEQFLQYEQQWKQYEQQMEGRKLDIQTRKQNVMNMNQNFQQPANFQSHQQHQQFSGYNQNFQGGNERFTGPSTGGDTRFPRPSPGGDVRFPEPSSGGDTKFPVPSPDADRQLPGPSPGGDLQFPGHSPGGDPQCPRPSSGRDSQFPRPSSGGDPRFQGQQQQQFGCPQRFQGQNQGGPPGPGGSNQHFPSQNLQGPKELRPGGWGGQQSQVQNIGMKSKMSNDDDMDLDVTDEKEDGQHSNSFNQNFNRPMGPRGPRFDGQRGARFGGPGNMRGRGGHQFQDQHREGPRGQDSVFGRGGGNQGGLPSLLDLDVNNPDEADGDEENLEGEEDNSSGQHLIQRGRGQGQFQQGNRGQGPRGMAPNNEIFRGRGGVGPRQQGPRALYQQKEDYDQEFSGPGGPRFPGMRGGQRPLFGQRFPVPDNRGGGGPRPSFQGRDGGQPGMRMPNMCQDRSPDNVNDVDEDVQVKDNTTPEDDINTANTEVAEIKGQDFEETGDALLIPESSNSYGSQRGALRGGRGAFRGGSGDQRGGHGGQYGGPGGFTGEQGGGPGGQRGPGTLQSGPSGMRGGPVGPRGSQLGGPGSQRGGPRGPVGAMGRGFQAADRGGPLGRGGPVRGEQGFQRGRGGFRGAFTGAFEQGMHEEENQGEDGFQVEDEFQGEDEFQDQQDEYQRYGNRGGMRGRFRGGFHGGVDFHRGSRGGPGGPRGAFGPQRGGQGLQRGGPGTQRGGPGGPRGRGGARGGFSGGFRENDYGYDGEEDSLFDEANMGLSEVNNARDICVQQTERGNPEGPERMGDVDPYRCGPPGDRPPHPDFTDRRDPFYTHPPDPFFDRRRDPYATSPPHEFFDRFRDPYRDPYVRDRYPPDPYLDRDPYRDDLPPPLRDPYLDRDPYARDPYPPRDLYPPLRDPYLDPYTRDRLLDRDRSPYADPMRNPYRLDTFRDGPPPAVPEASSMADMPKTVIDYGHGKNMGNTETTHNRERSRSREKSHDKDRDRDRGRGDKDRRREREKDRERDRLKKIETEREKRIVKDKDKLRDRIRDRLYGDWNKDLIDRESPPSGDRKIYQAKIETAKVEDLLIKPGRLSRPPLIVVIVRGLPGSGKTYVSKLIRDKEVSNGGAAPRMLCLDDYFMVEVEQKGKDPETGKQVKTKVLEYQYESEVEEAYRQSLYKSFKKTIDDGFFPFILIDAIHEKVKHFEEFWSYAKSKGFQVYIVEVEADVSTCIKRNIHNWQQKDVEMIKKGWEVTPSHFMRLDIRWLLQEDSIVEVEMEDERDEDAVKSPDKEEEEKDDDDDDDDDDEHEYIGAYQKSKWDIAEKSESQMDKLDGIRKRKRTASPQGWDDYLQIAGEDYFNRTSVPGKKRVRWVDIEEHKQQTRQRQIGFVIGQTQRDWDRITDDNFAHRAMNQTKYI